MTLIQKITDKVQDLPLEASPTQKDIDNYYLTINNLVEIAERFAKDILRVYISNKTLQYKQSQGEYSMDELLLIIKKEINL